MSRRERRQYTAEFKSQIVALYHAGHRKVDLIREYELTDSALSRWIKQAESTGSFKHKDNLSEVERENIKLRKENQQLKMENDILSQAALIIGRRKP